MFVIFQFLSLMFNKFYYGVICLDKIIHSLQLLQMKLFSLFLLMRCISGVKNITDFYVLFYNMFCYWIYPF